MADEMHDVLRDGNRAAANRVVIIINGPPNDRRCNICRRHIDELPAFGGPGDPLVGDFSGAKLVKTFREDYPGCSGASWECRDCIARQGGLWELAREDQLGRPLSDSERDELRYDGLRGLHEMHLERRLTAAECEGLKTYLDYWEPGKSVEEMLNAKEAHRKFLVAILEQLPELHELRDG